MPTFTRKHYFAIGLTLKKLSPQKKAIEFKKFNKIFKADNPRYQPERFKKFIGLQKKNK